MDLKTRYENSITNNELFVMTKEDLKEDFKEIKKTIETEEDLIMVHATNHFDGEMLIPQLETDKENEKHFTLNINGEEKTYNYFVKSSTRNSIHFCLNSVVSDHEYGQWSKCKYVIAMPLISNKENIVGGTECDLFTEGSIPVKEDAYIFCTKEEFPKFSDGKTKANIIVCDDDLVVPYVNVFLNNVLGYKHKTPTEKSRFWNSGFGTEHDNAVKIIKGNNWEYTIHNGSKYSDNDCRKSITRNIIEIIKTIQNNHIMYEINNFDQVKMLLEKKFDDAYVMHSYSFVDDLRQESLFREVKENIYVETGIDIGSFQPQYDAYIPIAEGATINLRRQALARKKELGILNDIDKIQMNYEKYVGDWYQDIKEGKISQEFLRDLDVYRDLLNFNFDDLTEEQKEIIITVLNKKLALENGNDLLKMSYFDEDVPEYDDIDIDVYQKAVSKGLYLGTSHSLSDILSGQQLNDKLRTQEISYYEYGKITDNLNPHLHFGRISHFITDCDLSDCKSIKEISERVEKYSYAFNAMLKDNDITFDRFGNITEEEIYVEEETAKSK